MRDTVVWRGSSSPLLNIQQYLGAFFAGAALMRIDLRLVAIPVAFCAWSWLKATSMRYELTRTRLRMYSGIISKEVEELALSEVKDYQVLQPWFFKLFGLGTVILITDESAEYQPCVICVPDPEKLVSTIRRLAGGA